MLGGNVQSEGTFLEDGCLFKNCKWFRLWYLQRPPEVFQVIFKSDDGKSFNQEQAIDLLVSLVATDANSEKKWKGFYNSLSNTELQDEWDEYWKT